jgi:hypothetical protein
LTSATFVLCRRGHGAGDAAGAERDGWWDAVVTGVTSMRQRIGA